MVKYVRREVPDCLYPCDAETGVPILDANRQATNLEIPVVRWGSLSKRSVKTAKTLHFYTDDDRLQPLLTYPENVLLTDAVQCCEVNFSLAEQTPKWFGHYYIYMKRFISRFWQDNGIHIYVDLNVAPKFREDNMIGVPLGWRAFSYRGYHGHTKENILDAYYLAEDWSEGKSPYFFVYGGGRDVRDLCSKYGFMWVPESVHYYERGKGHSWVQKVDALTKMKVVPSQLK